jgi:hypothetical protein
VVAVAEAGVVELPAVAGVSERDAVEGVFALAESRAVAPSLLLQAGNDPISRAMAAPVNIDRLCILKLKTVVN